MPFPGPSPPHCLPALPSCSSLECPGHYRRGLRVALCRLTCPWQGSSAYRWGCPTAQRPRTPLSTPTQVPLHAGRCHTSPLAISRCGVPEAKQGANPPCSPALPLISEPPPTAQPGNNHPLRKAAKLGARNSQDGGGVGWGCRQWAGRALTLESRGPGCLWPPPAVPARAPHAGAASAGEGVEGLGEVIPIPGLCLLASLLSPPALASEVGTDH